MSNVFSRSEFVAFLTAFNQTPPNDKFSSGSMELIRSLRLLSERKAIPRRAEPDRRLFCTKIADGDEIEIWSLSPSDACMERFMRYIASNMPQKGVTKTRAPSIHANETAVALLIKYGNHAVLLGADLEETHKGWTAILESGGRPQQKSTLFKVPHHGSQNGHHDGVWEKMLAPNPVSILTPYNRGSKLPTEADIARIAKRSERAFTTRHLRKTRKPSRSSLVEKMIKATATEIAPIDKSIGHIRATLNPHTDDWDIELHKGAAPLLDATA
ncbi:ComEC/Rec2 family competence protein [Metapseudomonas furukawaii]|uniref:hypothetical protein n=1 Tax=Metapseudomonas furukawaii TaxID=1149133 RepID=UPI001E3ECEC3|nr:hypothetical protein [Pseudomonas furukawaii]